MQRRPELTYAIGQHAISDLAVQYRVKPGPVDRLPDEQFEKLYGLVESALGNPVACDDAKERLRELRRAYEPKADAIARLLALDLPLWLPPHAEEQDVIRLPGLRVGRTSRDGMRVEQRPVTVPDFLATICRALGIDPTKQNQSNVGRPIRIVDKSARPLQEVLEVVVTRLHGGASSQRVLHHPVLDVLAAQPAAQVLHLLDREAAIVGQDRHLGRRQLLLEQVDLLHLLRSGHEKTSVHTDQHGGTDASHRCLGRRLRRARAPPAVCGNGGLYGAAHS